jgi:hypothetical protein
MPLFAIVIPPLHPFRHMGVLELLSKFLPQFAYTYAKTGLLLLLAEQA